jgi:hypothetical protein
MPKRGDLHHLAVMAGLLLAGLPLPGASQGQDRR